VNKERVGKAKSVKLTNGDYISLINEDLVKEGEEKLSFVFKISGSDLNRKRSAWEIESENMIEELKQQTEFYKQQA